MLEFIPIIYMTELNLLDRQVCLLPNLQENRYLVLPIVSKEYKSRAKATKHDEGIPYFTLLHGARGISS